MRYVFGKQVFDCICMNKVGLENILHTWNTFELTDEAFHYVYFQISSKKKLFPYVCPFMVKKEISQNEGFYFKMKLNFA